MIFYKTDIIRRIELHYMYLFVAVIEMSSVVLRLQYANEHTGLNSVFMTFRIFCHKPNTIILKL